MKYSIAETVGDSGTKYGRGVRLDSALLTGLTDAERKQMVKLRVVEEFAGNSFIAYDNGTHVEISIAQKGGKNKTDSGNKKQVLKELYNKKLLFLRMNSLRHRNMKAQKRHTILMIGWIITGKMIGTGERYTYRIKTIPSGRHIADCQFRRR